MSILKISLQVLATPVQLLHTDENFVAINKPNSVPVHPIGRFKVCPSRTHSRFSPVVSFQLLTLHW